MIIWGWTGRESEQQRGDFHCPRCCRPEKYKMVRVSTYFTLYFIPLFETSHQGDYVECLRCNAQYHPEVLDLAPGSSSGWSVEAVRADLEAGLSLQHARSRLLKDGADPQVADKLADGAAGPIRRHCARCRLDFVKSVDHCSDCGKALPRD